MSYLKLPKIEDLKDREKELALDAIKRWKYFPNIERAYALAPEVMEAEDVWSKGVMYVGFLDRSFKEAIATVVSSVNRCSYCANIHVYANTLSGSDDQKAIACAHFDFNAFNEREIIGLKFTRKAAGDSKSIGQKDIDELKKHFSQGEIVEIAAVIQQFMGYNWFVTILGLEVEQENPFNIDFSH